MSADSPALDPYRPPSLPEGPYAEAPPSGRPGLLTTLCVLCLVLGALGVMNSLMGAAGAVGGQKLQAMLQPKASAGMPPEMQQAQQDFQDQVNAVQGKFFWEIVGGLAFRLIASVLLLVGGIRSLGLKESGRKTLLVACTVAVVFELAHSILQSLVNMEMMTAVHSFVEKMTTAMPQQDNAPPGMGNLLQGIIRGSIIAGFVVSYVLALAKICLYVFGLIYLQKKHIRGLFQPG
jgi:hypothetical protein